MATDFSSIFGGSILSFVEKTIGSIQNVDKPYSISSKGETAVVAYVASVRDNPSVKILFTLGLFAQKVPNGEFLMRECFICLPEEWPLPYYQFDGRLLKNGLTSAPYFPETLPLDLLEAITISLQRKNNKFLLGEGVFLDKRKGVYAKFNWADDMTGVTLINYQWDTEPGEDTGNNTEKDSAVTLLTIVPVFDDKKALSSKWYAQRRYGTWNDLSFPLFSDVASLDEMNRAFIDKDWKLAMELLEKGVAPNRGVYEAHPIWGDLVSYTYLEKAMIGNALELTKRLIELGAKVPQDALALIAGTCGVEAMFDYLLSLGCDVNAVDNVGYTALNRAVAFDNQPIIERCKSLGGVYRVYEYDTEEKLQTLSDMGIKLDKTE